MREYIRKAVQTSGRCEVHVATGISEDGRLYAFDPDCGSNRARRRVTIVEPPVTCEKCKPYAGLIR
jgi:hypothetical protein